MIVREIQPCSVGSSCRNSPEIAGRGGSKCHLCRLAPYNETLADQHWRPLVIGEKHPILLLEKRQKTYKRTFEKRQQRLHKDRSKTTRLRKSVTAEKSTVDNLIKNTKNSGRSNRDGDHVAAGRITLDTKHQSLRSNPLVLLSELSKVEEQAQVQGNLLGALVLRQKHGLGVVVMSEEAFARLLKLLEISNDSGSE